MGGLEEYVAAWDVPHGGTFATYGACSRSVFSLPEPLQYCMFMAAESFYAGCKAMGNLLKGVIVAPLCLQTQVVLVPVPVSASAAQSALTTQRPALPIWETS